MGYWKIKGTVHGLESNIRLLEKYLNETVDKYFGKIGSAGITIESAQKEQSESLLCPDCGSDDIDECHGIANTWCKRCGFTWNNRSDIKEDSKTPTNTTKATITLEKLKPLIYGCEEFSSPIDDWMKHRLWNAVESVAQQ